MLELDHLAVTAPSLEEGVAAIESALGVALAPGGRHAHMGTWNRLLSLGPGLYLEVIAPDPAAPRPAWPRWFGLDTRASVRLTNWVARTGDLEAALATAPAGAGAAVDLDRADLRWRMGIPASGLLPYDDCFPALIQWQSGGHPSERLPDAGCRLRRLVIGHPQAAEMSGLLALADPRLVLVVDGTVGLTAEIETPSGVKVLQ
ncbi:VOC family protein [Frigidibacter albus]|uniref:VOC family protein n=1 Tax=Frigidibacter albus TaxID=1465486 RepID=A0A6L8VD75_9RHOB|nr:VOC family protein [Frigidibacter albus]MZQ88268.1 VOC family protein [Frigidibacter albus]NBE30058.1 VOC family protein [Frigidibacter albus]GGH46441.1 polyphosphate kinase [Frigidibacter albus]